MSTAGTAASSRYCASIVSRFMIPGQMAAFDVLARASTFPVSASSAAHASRNDAPEHHWVTSKHVVAPFFYRDSFYREQAEWLRFVEPEHVKVTVELRSDVGELMWEGEAESEVVYDENLDLAAVHLTRRASDALATTLALDPLELVSANDSGPLARDDALVCGGHVLDGVAADDPECSPRPLALPARFVGVGSGEGTRHFLMTEEALTMGMCGGPVLRKSDARCAGMIEGAVNDESSELHIGAFIGHDKLASFVAEIEAQWT